MSAKQSSGGKKINMLQGSIWDKILRFALPIACASILQQLFNAADIAVVGRFTGDGTISIAAVGTNAPLINLIVNLFAGMALGANVVIAKAIGSRNQDTVEKAVHSAIVFSLLIGLVVLGLCEGIAEPVLKLINVEPTVLPYALKYLRIYLIGIPFILLLNFESAIFRSCGDTKTPLFVLAGAGVLNVGLNFLFVTAFGMDVEGVAVATLISNVLSSAVLFVILTKTKLPVKIYIKKLRIYKSTFTKILRIGVPAGLQSSIFSLANIIIQSAINSLGATVMAGSSAAYNVEIFAFYVMSSFGQACTTFVGQNFGAGQIDRCKKTLRDCICECAIMVALVSAIFIPFGKNILSIFNPDPEVINIGYIRLFCILISFVFSLVYDNQAAYMRGFGISLVPAILTMLGVCGTRIIWIYVVFPKNPTFENIMLVYPISLAITAVMMTCANLIVRPSKKFAIIELEPND